MGFLVGEKDSFSAEGFQHQAKEQYACAVSRVGPQGGRLGPEPFKVQTFGGGGLAQPENAFHMSMRTWVQIPGAHGEKLDVVHICNHSPEEMQTGTHL